MEAGLKFEMCKSELDIDQWGLPPSTQAKQKAPPLVSGASGKRAVGLQRCIEIAVNEWGEIDFRRFALRVLLAPLPNGSFGRVRATIYRWLGIRVGKSTLIRGRLTLSGERGCSSRLTIGRKCFFTTPLHIDLNGDVIIGDNVTIGHDVTLVTSGHHIGGPERRCGGEAPQPIRIGDGCWIGARVLLLPGVVLGPGSIVAAGAVVIGSVEPHTIVGGVPARLIRRLDDGSVQQV